MIKEELMKKDAKLKERVEEMKRVEIEDEIHKCEVEILQDRINKLEC